MTPYTYFIPYFTHLCKRYQNGIDFLRMFYTLCLKKAVRSKNSLAVSLFQQSLLYYKTYLGLYAQRFINHPALPKLGERRKNNANENQTHE